MSDVNTAATIEGAGADEDFLRSNAACMRSIAGDREQLADFQSSNADTLLGFQAPVLDGSSGGAEQAMLRGIGDTIALLSAHHNVDLHRQLQPTNGVDSQLFDTLERVRCESLGCQMYRGVEKNLVGLRLRVRTKQVIRSYSGVKQLALVLECLARESLTNTPADKPAVTLVEAYRAAIEARVAVQLNQLRQVQYEQSAYANVALELIALLDTQQLKSVQKADEAEVAKAEQHEEQSDNDEPIADTPRTDADEEALLEQAAADAMREELEQQEETIKSAADDADEHGSVDQNRDAPVSSDGEMHGRAASEGAGGYTVFTHEYDEVITAAELSSESELNDLRDRLDQQIERHSQLVGRLSGRLQRLLMAEQQRHWMFDLDEGHLDTSRLTRLVTQPLSALTFKAESELKFRDTTITLLLDNSKSMLGKPITIAASCADLLAQTMERCGVSIEILGFTTTELHGGQSLDLWQQGGAKQNPGRLNALRHIVYKSADTPYRSARKGLGLMLRGDLLKQNIDGEALLWASSRIQRRPEQRKIIMMISDGAPIDTSTMSANRDNFLVDHLHQVIADINAKRELELVAIGIGHDVSVYYDKSITIYDVKKLGRAMLSQLSELFRDDGRGS